MLSTGGRLYGYVRQGWRVREVAEVRGRVWGRREEESEWKSRNKERSRTLESEPIKCPVGCDGPKRP